MFVSNYPAYLRNLRSRKVQHQRHAWDILGRKHHVTIKSEADITSLKVKLMAERNTTVESMFVLLYFFIFTVVSCVIVLCVVCCVLCSERTS